MNGVGRDYILRVCVPAAKAKIKTADASSVIIDDKNLLVVGPNLNRVDSSDMIGMALKGVGKQGIVICKRCTPLT